MHIGMGVGQVLDEVSSVACRRGVQPCVSGAKLVDGMVGGGRFCGSSLGGCLQDLGTIRNSILLLQSIVK